MAAELVLYILAANSYAFALLASIRCHQLADDSTVEKTCPVSQLKSGILEPRPALRVGALKLVWFLTLSRLSSFVRLWFTSACVLWLRSPGDSM